MPVTLQDDVAEKAVASIRRYFSEQLDQDIGDLQAGLVLEFFLKEIGPSVYNAAIGDAQTYFRDRAADLEGVCFVPEFGYWPKSARRAR